MPLPGAIFPAETGEIRARGEARRSEVDQSILQGMVRFGDVNVADKRCTTSRCRKAIIPIPWRSDPGIRRLRAVGSGHPRLARSCREGAWVSGALE